MPPWLIHTLATMALWGGWGVVSKPLSSQLSAWQVQSLSTIGLVPRDSLAGPFTRACLRAPGPPRVLAVLRRRGGRQRGERGLLPGARRRRQRGGRDPLHLLVSVGDRSAGGRDTPGAPQWTFPNRGHHRVLRAALYLFNVGSDAASPLTPWLGVALIPVLLWGVSALLQKMATAHGSPELVTLAFLMGFLPLGAVTPAFRSFEWNLDPRTWALLVALGLFFGLGNLTLIFAYGRGGRASVVTPLASLYSIVTIPAAIVFLGERPGFREGLAVASRRPRRHRRPRHRIAVANAVRFPIQSPVLRSTAESSALTQNPEPHFPLMSSSLKQLMHRAPSSATGVTSSNWSAAATSTAVPDAKRWGPDAAADKMHSRKSPLNARLRCGNCVASSFAPDPRCSRPSPFSGHANRTEPGTARRRRPSTPPPCAWRAKSPVRWPSSPGVSPARS